MSWRPASDINGNAYVGATLQYFAAGTNDAAAIYSDQAGEASVGASLTSGAGGWYANHYLDTGVSYKVVETVNGSVRTWDWFSTASDAVVEDETIQSIAGLELRPGELIRATGDDTVEAAAEDDVTKRRDQPLAGLTRKISGTHASMSLLSLSPSVAPTTELIADGSVSVTEQFVRDHIRLLHGMGVETVVVLGVEQLAYWFMERDTYPYSKDQGLTGAFWYAFAGGYAGVENFVPVTTVMEETAKYGMKAVLGIGYAGDVNILQDIYNVDVSMLPDPMRFSETMATRKADCVSSATATTRAIVAAYGGFTSFGGIFHDREPDHLNSSAAFLASVNGAIRAELAALPLDKQKVYVSLPNPIDLTEANLAQFGADLATLDIDAVLMQDSMGSGFDISSGTAGGPSGQSAALASYDQYYRFARRAVDIANAWTDNDKHAISLGAYMEVWESSTASSYTADPFPAASSRLEDQWQNQMALCDFGCWGETYPYLFATGSTTGPKQSQCGKTDFRTRATNLYTGLRADHYQRSFRLKNTPPRLAWRDDRLPLAGFTIATGTNDYTLQDADQDDNSITDRPICGWSEIELDLTLHLTQAAPLDGILSSPALAIHSTPEQFVIGAATSFRLSGAYFAKAATTALTFSSGHVVTASLYGIILVQINAAGTVSTKAPASPQAYASAAAALAALPTPDSGNVALGYIAIQNNAGDWTANTDDLTNGSDLTTASFNNATLATSLTNCTFRLKLDSSAAGLTETVYADTGRVNGPVRLNHRYRTNGGVAKTVKVTTVNSTGQAIVVPGGFLKVRELA